MRKQIQRLHVPDVQLHKRRELLAVAGLRPALRAPQRRWARRDFHFKRRVYGDELGVTRRCGDDGRDCAKIFRTREAMTLKVVDDPLHAHLADLHAAKGKLAAERNHIHDCS